MSENVLKKDDELLKNRLIELSGISYRKNIPANSDFLNLHEQSLFHSVRFSVFSLLDGGYELAERKIALFKPDEDFYMPSPISVLKITPLSARFSEKLTHRDFLGSVLGLGIERSKIGDILVRDNSAYLFCINSLSDYIINNLTRIRNTPCIATRCDDIPEDFSPEFKEITGTVSSLRLDCLLALAYNLSRSKVISYIEDAQVFINGKLITTNSFTVRDGDIISVRHLGRFTYVGASNTTKKGRIFVKLLKYI